MPHDLKCLALALLAILFAAPLVPQRFEARTAVAADYGGEAPQAVCGSFAEHFGLMLVGPTAVGLSDAVDGVIVLFESLLSSQGGSEDRREKIYGATPYGGRVLRWHRAGPFPSRPTYPRLDLLRAVQNGLATKGIIILHGASGQGQNASSPIDLATT